MEFVITIILILIFFQFLPLILIIAGIGNILSGNLFFGILLLIFGLLIGSD